MNIPKLNWCISCDHLHHGLPYACRVHNCECIGTVFPMKSVRVIDITPEPEPLWEQIQAHVAWSLDNLT